MNARRQYIPPRITSFWKKKVQPSNKRQEIIYALETRWTKRDQNAMTMANIEKQGQSLNADGDRNSNSIRNSPVDDQRIHSHGFREISVSKGDGPPSIDAHEMNQSQKNIKFYGSIEPSKGQENQQSFETVPEDNAKLNRVVLGSDPNTNINANDIITKSMQPKVSQNDNPTVKISTGNKVPVHEAISNQNHYEHSTQNEANGFASNDGDTRSIHQDTKENGNNKSNTGDPSGKSPATFIILGQPNVQMMPVPTGGSFTQNVLPGNQPYANIVPVIPPQSNLLLPVLQQPVDNVEKRGVFLQPIQQIQASPLMYNPMVMTPQPQYYNGLPQYSFLTLGQKQPQDQSSLYVSSQNQLQPFRTIGPLDSTMSSFYPQQTDTLSGNSENGLTDNQDHSRNEVMDDSDVRENEEQKEREREESDEREKLYENDRDDYENDREDEEEDDHPEPEPENDREGELESDVTGTRRDEEEEAEENERYYKLRNRNFQSYAARMQFLRENYPEKLQQESSQRHYPHLYPADEDKIDETQFGAGVRPSLNGPELSHFDDLRQDGPEVYRFDGQSSMSQNNLIPMQGMQSLEPGFNDMRAETFSRFQVSNPESELRPNVFPISLPNSETSPYSKDMVSLPPNMKITEMSAERARLLEIHQAQLRMPNSPLASKDKIPKHEIHNKVGLANTMILLNGKPLEDAAQLRSHIVNGKIVQGKGKIIKSKGPVKVRMSHTKDSSHMKIINIIAPQKYRVIDTRNKIRTPKTLVPKFMAKKAKGRLSMLKNDLKNL